MRLNRIVGLFALIVVSGCFAMMQPAPEPVVARPPILTSFNAAYPDSATSNADCQVCHLNSFGSEPWNTYGWSIRQRMLDGMDHLEAIAAVEALDADGNGVSNGDEIVAGAQPGWAAGPVNTLHFQDGSAMLNQEPPALDVLLDVSATITPTIIITPTNTPTITSTMATPEPSATMIETITPISTQAPTIVPTIVMTPTTMTPSPVATPTAITIPTIMTPLVSTTPFTTPTTPVITPTATMTVSSTEEPSGELTVTQTSVPTVPAIPSPITGTVALTNVVIGEIFYQGGEIDDWFELQNFGGTTVDVSDWWLCIQGRYESFANLSVLIGDLLLSPGEIVVIRAPFDLPLESDFSTYAGANGEQPEFANPAHMIDFVQWGSPVNQGRADVAVQKGIWAEDSPDVYAFVPSSAITQSLALTDGHGDSVNQYANGHPSQGVANSVSLFYYLPYVVPTE